MRAKDTYIFRAWIPARAICASREASRVRTSYKLQTCAAMRVAINIHSLRWCYIGPCFHYQTDQSGFVDVYLRARNGFASGPRAGQVLSADTTPFGNVIALKSLGDGVLDDDILKKDERERER